MKKDKHILWYCCMAILFVLFGCISCSSDHSSYKDVGRSAFITRELDTIQVNDSTYVVNAVYNYRTYGVAVVTINKFIK